MSRRKASLSSRTASAVRCEQMTIRKLFGVEVFGTRSRRAEGSTVLGTVALGVQILGEPESFYGSAYQYFCFCERYPNYETPAAWRYALHVRQVVADSSERARRQAWKPSPAVPVVADFARSVEVETPVLVMASKPEAVRVHVSPPPTLVG